MRRVRGSHSISIERLSSTSISDALLNKSQGAGRTKQDRSHNGYPGRSLAMSASCAIARSMASIAFCAMMKLSRGNRQ